MKNLFVMLLIVGGVLSVSAQDLTITDISRVAGKSELKVTIANKGKAAASNVKLRIYALPYGFCSKQSPYSPADENGGYPCFDSPSTIPAGMLITSVDGAKNMLGLAWSSVNMDGFSAPAGATVEKIVKLPAQPPPALPGQTKHKVFPVPYFSYNSAYTFAPRSILTFDLGVFYAVVEADGDPDKANNEYFYNIRRRANQ